MFMLLAIAPGAVAAHPMPPTGSPRDFNFESGSWQTHLRVRAPLSKGNAWAMYDGTTVVHPIWSGRGNVELLDVRHGQSRVQAVTLRLYDPTIRRWRVYFANGTGGGFGAVDTGGFKNGRGRFYDRETFQRRPVDVMLMYFAIRPNSFTFEQSYSTNGGKNWIPNWISTFRRTPGTSSRGW